MMQYAPIVIPTLCRYEHFKRCVESLSQCTLADKTQLYIGLDFPKNESHYEGYQLISEYLPKISGFKKVTVIRRSVNYGASKNADELERLVYEQHDRIIETEDDNEFSPNFLEYINMGLDRFENDPRIIAVCGYWGEKFEFGKYSSNFLIRRGFNGWGFGTWRDKLGKIEYTPDEILEFIANPVLRKRLFATYERKFYAIFPYILKNAVMWGDGATEFEMIQKDLYCVYPTRSKVRNHGHDGSGVHGGHITESPYSRISLDSEQHFAYEGKPGYEMKRYIARPDEDNNVSYITKLKSWLLLAKRPSALFKVINALTKSYLSKVKDAY